MRAADVDACVNIVSSHPLIGARYGDEIQELRLSWFRLIECPAKTMVLFEEVDGAAARLLGIGVSVFVSDAFMRVVKTPPLFWINSAELSGAPERTREKKRRLLTYLRDHTEELRPISRKFLPRRTVAPTMREPPIVSGF